MSLADAPVPTNALADAALQAILEEIAVPMAVLLEGRKRRDLVLAIAMGDPLARAQYSTGSLAYGTAINPFKDADCGVLIDRRRAAARALSPEGVGAQRPEALMRHFAERIVEALRRRGYPKATYDLSGKRSVEFHFHEPVDTDEAGVIDPYVDFIVGVDRAAGGTWIPNKHLAAGWDVGDPAGHLTVMNYDGPRDVRVFRAQLIRLVKRAIEHEAKRASRPIMCSWNACALALEHVEEASRGLAQTLADLLGYMASSVAKGLTRDPSPYVEPIELPNGVSRAEASVRLRRLAEWAAEAAAADSRSAARRSYANLYGPELDAIRARERGPADRRLAAGAPLAGTALSTHHKPTRSDGARP